jgi:hypothetical protein
MDGTCLDIEASCSSGYSYEWKALAYVASLSLLLTSYVLGIKGLLRTIQEDRKRLVQAITSITDRVGQFDKDNDVTKINKTGDDIKEHAFTESTPESNSISSGKVGKVSVKLFPKVPDTKPKDARTRTNKTKPTFLI